MELDKLIEKFKNQTMQEQGDYIEPEDNVFDAPIPGQSLTDEPGNYPWEHAPQTASIEEATDYVYESMMKPENMERMFTLLRMGIPIEALVKIITFSGFLEGRWTVDTAKLLEPIVAMMIAGEAAIAEIPAKVNMGDAIGKSKDQSLPSYVSVQNLSFVAEKILMGSQMPFMREKLMMDRKSKEFGKFVVDDESIETLMQRAPDWRRQMELTGTILQIGTTKEYGSNNFKKRELVLSTDEQYPQKVLIEFVQDKCQVLDNYKKDDGVTIGINIKGREWINNHNQKKFFYKMFLLT